jgi:hypothetical protein
MRGSGIPTVHGFTIDLPNFEDTANVFVFSDMHMGTDAYSDSSLCRYRDYAESHKNRYYILGADTIDFASTSERRLLVANPALHETTVSRLNDMAIDLADRAIEKLSFMKGRLIGGVDGNHNFPLRFGDLEISTEEYIINKLGGKYLAEVGFLTLKFNWNGYKFVKKGLIHHGLGGGQTPGGSLNPLVNLQKAFDFDFITMGHNHKLGSIVDQRATWDGKGLYDRDIAFVRTGTFAKAYEIGKANYAVKRLYAPATLRGVKIEFRPFRREDDSGQRRLGAEIFVTT